MAAETMNTNPMSMPVLSAPAMLGAKRNGRAVAAPLLNIWKADMVASFVGLLVFACLAVFVRTVDPGIAFAAGVAYLVCEIVYIARIYPSYFTEKPASTSCVSTSFLNMFFGGILFGSLWNRNLSRREKGVSHVVRACLAAVLFVCIVAF